MRLTSLFAALALGLFFVQCDSGGNSSDGQSSWLRACARDGDCAAPSTCECGVCTISCSAGNDCTGLPKPSACIEVSAEANGGRCRLGSAARVGLCLPACNIDADCGPSNVLRCAAGACVVRNESVRDAASFGDASTGFDGAPRAPRPGEAPPNAYGGPVDINLGVDRLCPLGTHLMRPSGQACLLFVYCAPDCPDGGECPSVSTGTARPLCEPLGGYCALFCTNGETCPTGMVCMNPSTGASIGGKPYERVCAWVADDTSVGCPAHCKLDPIPRDCPNWCAAIGVACDPTKGVECCAGLSCGTGKFCEAKD